MAEISTRDLLEKAFAARLGKLGERHRQQLIAKLGMPPNVANIPDSLWTAIKREIEDEAAAMMALIFLASEEEHGYVGGAASVAAEGYAATQSRQFATQWVETSQRRLLETSNRWQRQIEEAPTEDPETGEPVEPPGISRQQITEDTTSIFGPQRAEGAAVNETTRARHQGSETAIESTVGISEQDTWFNSGSNVCEICEPLHNTPRSVWSAKFPEGPPQPHNKCKCYIRYANWPNVPRDVWDGRIEPKG